VLMDFGLARLVTDSANAMTRTGRLIGTLSYVSPEQIASPRDVTGAADIYSLAIMAYRMLTGQLPYDSDNTAALILSHLYDPIPDPRTIVPGLPAAAALAVMRAMSKGPADRYPTAMEFVRMLVSQQPRPSDQSAVARV